MTTHYRQPWRANENGQPRRHSSSPLLYYASEHDLPLLACPVLGGVGVDPPAHLPRLVILLFRLPRLFVLLTAAFPFCRASALAGALVGALDVEAPILVFVLFRFPTLTGMSLSL